MANTNIRIRIYQYFNRNEHWLDLEQDFLPLDLGRGTYHIIQEQTAILQKAAAFRFTPNKYLGFVPWHFQASSGMTGEELIESLTQNPDFDVYYLNTSKTDLCLSKSIWSQGDYQTPGLTKVAQRLFDRLKYDIDLESLLSFSTEFPTNNGWIGTERFWKEYHAFCAPILSALMDQNAASEADQTAPYQDPIVERLFGTFIAVNRNRFRGMAIRKSPEESRLVEAATVDKIKSDLINGTSNIDTGYLHAALSTFDEVTNKIHATQETLAAINARFSARGDLHEAHVNAMQLRNSLAFRAALKLRQSVLRRPYAEKTIKKALAIVSTCDKGGKRTFEAFKKSTARCKSRLASWGILKHDRFRPTEGSLSYATYTERTAALASAFTNSKTSTDSFHIVFAVTDVGDQTYAGDYFTAFELGSEIQKLTNWRISFCPRSEWYSPLQADVLIVMTHSFDILKASKGIKVRIAWMRNWFHKWKNLVLFDLVLVSSAKAQTYVNERYHLKSQLLRIATNPRAFQNGKKHPNYVCDYCFVGSYFGHERDIEKYLDPSELPYAFSLFGHNWHQSARFASYTKGPIAYSQVPDIYASTRIVVDDANHVTKAWGSTNSRVFDALAAGALVITNSEESSNESFDNLLPAYKTKAELYRLLDLYLTNEELRSSTVTKLRSHVLNHHTYAKRARQITSLLRPFFVSGSERLKFAIKIGVPTWSQKDAWGDYHFAVSLKRSLEKHGHMARIDILPDWYHSATALDDVVLVLRGLSRYQPRPSQINLMWNISHPDTVSEAEYNAYDHIFVASHTYRPRTEKPVTPLLQCADPEVFYPTEDTENHRYLFVGNSRRILRKAVADCLSIGETIAIYGADWDGLVPAHLVHGIGVKNKDLNKYYCGSTILLNDHWDDMREKGFLSNRLFDAAACGAFVISDRVAGLDAVFGRYIPTYETPDELNKLLNRFSLDSPEKRAMQTALFNVSKRHTFDHRVKDLLEIVRLLLQSRAQDFKPHPDFLCPHENGQESPC